MTTTPQSTPASTEPPLSLSALATTLPRSARNKAGDGNAETAPLATTRPRPARRVRESEILLGKGGMALVRAGWQSFPWGEEPCAVKRLHEDMLSAEHVRAFEREAFIGRKIARGHPGLVMIEDYQIDEQGPFIVMERVDGARAHDVRRLVRGNWRVIRRIARDALSILRHVHGCGVLHRDISAGNVMLDRRGAIRICDLGMARRVDEPQSVGFAGTVAYASPERLNQESATTASDVYSLGAVLWELAIGVAPYGAGSRLDVLMKMAEPLPALPAGTPNDAVQLLVGMLSRETGKRPTVDEALMMLEDDGLIADDDEIIAVVDAWRDSLFVCRTDGMTSNKGAGADSGSEASRQGSQAGNTDSGEPAESAANVEDAADDEPDDPDVIAAAVTRWLIHGEDDKPPASLVDMLTRAGLQMPPEAELSESYESDADSSCDDQETAIQTIPARADDGSAPSAPDVSGVDASPSPGDADTPDDPESSALADSWFDRDPADPGGRGLTGSAGSAGGEPKHPRFRMVGIAISVAVLASAAIVLFALLRSSNRNGPDDDGGGDNTNAVAEDSSSELAKPDDTAVKPDEPEADDLERDTIEPDVQRSDTNETAVPAPVGPRARRKPSLQAPVKTAPAPRIAYPTPYTYGSSPDEVFVTGTEWDVEPAAIPMTP